MIATRLHAQRKSSSTHNRPSIISIPSTAHLHVHSPSRRTSQRPSSDVQIIENVHAEEQLVKEVHESSQVDSISST